MATRAVGLHLILDMWGCDERIGEPSSVREAIEQAALASGASVLETHVHAFSPHGVTGVAILAESHLAVHTWPEYGYLAADLFSCGRGVRTAGVVDVFKQWFRPERIETRRLSRGRFHSRGGAKTQLVG